MAEIICGIYRIINTITGDFYIGSSKDVKRRWAAHKCPSTWNRCPNNPMYLDFQKYGLGNFDFQILAEVEIEQLKKMEQQFIELLKPTYNDRNANGRDAKRYKEYNKEYQKEYRKTDKYKEYEKSDKRKESKRTYQKSDKFKKYQKSDKFKKYQKEYYKSDKGKESSRKASNKYNNQLCCYNGETITLGALSKRFMRKGITHPTIEAKKYLML